MAYKWLYYPYDLDNVTNTILGFIDEDLKDKSPEAQNNGKCLSCSHERLIPLFHIIYLHVAILCFLVKIYTMHYSFSINKISIIFLPFRYFPHSELISYGSVSQMSSQFSLMTNTLAKSAQCVLSSINC